MAARIVETIADIDINLRLAAEFGGDITRPAAKAQRALGFVAKQFAIDTSGMLKAEITNAKIIIEDAMFCTIFFIVIELFISSILLPTPIVTQE